MENTTFSKLSFFQIINLRYSLKDSQLLSYLPCFLAHKYKFTDDNACYGFRFQKCDKYLKIKELSIQSIEND